MSDIDEYFAFQTSSPNSLRQSTSPHQLKNVHDYNFSGIIYDETTDASPSTDEEEHVPLRDDHDLLRLASTRVSSVSSFPASVIHHTLPDEGPRTPSKTFFDYEQDRTTTPTYQSPRAHSTGFRHPSSVRALQMRDEFELSELEGLASSRRRDSRLSFFSQRSSGSAPNSPIKRMIRSNHSSPQKSNKTKLRKEFPLVLLHCTLLPPALALRASQLNDGILEAIIPQPYTRRWKALQEKVVRNTEVKARGVLIPHPRDEYELLEEKLLESLELERPRLRDGHFMATDEGTGATDSGFESASSSDQIDNGDVGVPSNTCPDCGKCVSHDAEAQRKWEIKVYAANGLLKASAWSAAWQEMEKVDVEVSVWMPEDVRREVDSRIEVLLEQEKAEKRNRRRERKQADDERLREIYGSDVPKPEDASQDRTQDEIDGLLSKEPTNASEHVARDNQKRGQPNVTIPQQDPQIDGPYQQCNQTDVALLDALANYVRLLAQDRRNIAIFLLTILVLFYGMKRPTQIPTAEPVDNSGPLVQDVQVTTSQLIVTSTSIVLATDTSTVTETISTVSSTGNVLHSETSSVPPNVISSLVSSIETAVQNHSTNIKEFELDPNSNLMDDEPLDIAQGQNMIPVDVVHGTSLKEDLQSESNLPAVPVQEPMSEARNQQVCVSPYYEFMLAMQQERCMGTSPAGVKAKPK